MLHKNFGKKSLTALAVAAAVAYAPVSNAALTYSTDFESPLLASPIYQRLGRQEEATEAAKQGCTAAGKSGGRLFLSKTVDEHGRFGFR